MRRCTWSLFAEDMVFEFAFSIELQKKLMHFHDGFHFTCTFIMWFWVGVFQKHETACWSYILYSWSQAAAYFYRILSTKLSINYIFFGTFHCPMFQVKVSFLTLSGRIWNSRRWFFRSVKTWLKETAPRVIVSVTLLARKSDILASQHLGYIDCRGKRVELFHLCFCLFRVHVKHNNWSLCT